MYSNKENVNILTALLVKYGISHAVVCPGSRNAPIVHNLNECPDILCFPVTDERSAGFYALGMAQALDEPVVVCVTSGTALLNVLPAVAEACYQHQSLIVISADRPAAWIGQLDGQTLQQPGALGPWVAKSVQLPEPSDNISRWHCNRLVNEVLLETERDNHPCVHINVPITEPLFDFTVEDLPDERCIIRRSPSTDYDCLPTELVEDLLNAERPLVIFGQTTPHQISPESIGNYLFSHVMTLHESLSPFPHVCRADEVLSACQPLLPDFVLYVGEAIVSKRLKAFLRQATTAKMWRVSTFGEVEDTFMNLRGIIVGNAEHILNSLSHRISTAPIKSFSYYRYWLDILRQVDACAASFCPSYSQMSAVSMLEKAVAENGPDACTLHYANSSSVRLANIFASHYVWCNRGVNGIEGSLSTAAGFSVVSSGMVVCVIGDLSFFYDQNALWNRNLCGNLRILLLNNGEGAIFGQLKGLEQSAASHNLVAGRHQTSAQGICSQNGIVYLSAYDQVEMEKGIQRLLTEDARCPVLLEVFTDASTDVSVLKDYYRSMRCIPANS